MKITLMVLPCSTSRWYVTKRLECVAEDHIATHTVLFRLKKALFFGFLGDMAVLNGIVLLVTFICGPGQLFFRRLDTYAPTHTAPTFVTGTPCLVTVVQLF